MRHLLWTTLDMISLQITNSKIFSPSIIERGILLECSWGSHQRFISLSTEADSGRSLMKNKIEKWKLKTKTKMTNENQKEKWKLQTVIFFHFHFYSSSSFFILVYTFFLHFHFLIWFFVLCRLPYPKIYKCILQVYMYYITDHKKSFTILFMCF